MERNKLDEFFRKHFAEREIEPSSNAWEKVSDKLDGAEMHPKSKWLRYASVAAVTAIVFSTVYYLEMAPKKNLVGPKAQEIPVEGTVLTDVENNTNSSDFINVQSEEVVQVDKEKENTPKEIVVEEDTFLAQNSGVRKEEKTEGSNVLIQDDGMPLNETDVLINKKIEEVLVQVTNMESDDNKLTDLEVEALLVQAQNEVLEETLVRKDNSIDPNALLSQVELELDQSFRDQIFDKLKIGFKKVRTALADRNN